MAEEKSGVGTAVRVALVLAGALLILVIGLNSVRPAPTVISWLQFQHLRQEGLLVKVLIRPSGWTCDLAETVRLREAREQREVNVNQVVVAPVVAPLEGQMAQWQAQGIVVEVGEDPEEETDWAGGLFMAALLGLGLWYLSSQIYQDVRGKGSPRRRLKELEEAYERGEISSEEYQRARTELWAEM